MGYYDRLCAAEAQLTPVIPKYCIVWFDPLSDTEIVRVTMPAPKWLAMALRGGALPPIGSKDMEATIGPMTEEQAIEHLVRMDIPEHVWSDHDRTNRPKFFICRRDQIPKDRTYRNAWRLAA